MSQWQTKSIKSKAPARRSKAYGPKTKRPMHLGRWLLAAVILVGGFYILTSILPKVEITVIPETHLISLEEDIELAERVAVSGQRVLLANKLAITSEATDDFAATGEKDIGEHASGSVTFFNLTGLAHDLAVEDGLENLDGIGFTVKTPLTIPSATVSGDGDIVPGRLDAELVALEPGADGNIEPQRVFISSVPPDKQNKIYAEVKARFGGGSSELVTVVSQEDLEAAQEKLEADIISQLREQIIEDLKLNVKEITETFKLENAEFSAAVSTDEEVEEFEATLKGTGSTYVYKESDLIDLIQRLLQPLLGSGEQFVGLEPSLLTFIQLAEPQKIRLNVAWPVSQRVPLDSLKASLMGLREADARRLLLAEPTIADVRFDWTTAISRRVPTIEERLNIIVRAR